MEPRLNQTNFIHNYFLSVSYYFLIKFQIYRGVSAPPVQNYLPGEGISWVQHGQPQPLWKMLNIIEFIRKPRGDSIEIYLSEAIEGQEKEISLLKQQISSLYACISFILELNIMDFHFKYKTFGLSIKNQSISLCQNIIRPKLNFLYWFN